MTFYLKSNESQDELIKKGLEEHLQETVERLKAKDGWELVSMPDLSKRQLMNLAKSHDLENDDQTHSFIQFISLSTNFASLDFTQRLLLIPEMVTSLKELLSQMEQEIKEFAEIASYFTNLIQSFYKLVINTKHNMKMTLPHLEASCLHMQIISQALMPHSAQDLDVSDRADIEMGLTHMSTGIQKLVAHAKTSKAESFELDKKINRLKRDVSERIGITRNRITFHNILPKLGAALGLASGATATGMVVESIAFGGAGALVVGGVAFPPLGAIILGATIGAFSIGSILFLISKLWEQRQFKALQYLTLILDKLNRLNSANLMFMEYMNKSEQDANQIVASMDFLKTNLTSGSVRYRQLNSELCLKAVESTKSMIKCISQIDEIDIDEWMTDKQRGYKITQFDSGIQEMELLHDRL